MAGQQVTFNRTLMELKYLYKVNHFTVNFSFNRTLMELKWAFTRL